MSDKTPQNRWIEVTERPITDKDYSPNGIIEVIRNGQMEYHHKPNVMTATHFRPYVHTAIPAAVMESEYDKLFRKTFPDHQTHSSLYKFGLIAWNAARDALTADHAKEVAELKQLLHERTQAFIACGAKRVKEISRLDNQIKRSNDALATITTALNEWKKF